MDTISSNHTAFEYARLRHLDRGALQLEIQRVSENNEMIAYLNLTRFRPFDKNTIIVRIIDQMEIFEEEVALLEGRMRLRLSNEMTQKLIKALEEGRNVQLQAGDLEGVIQSKNFTPLYQTLSKENFFLRAIKNFIPI